MGFRKNRQVHKGAFKPKHRYCAPFTSKAPAAPNPRSEWRPRMMTEEFNRVAKPSHCGKFYRVVDADGVYGTANLLLPKKETAPELTQVYLERQNDNRSGESTTPKSKLPSDTCR